MTKRTESLPLNPEVVAGLIASIERAQQQARDALIANGPRLAAAFEQMGRAMRGDR